MSSMLFEVITDAPHVPANVIAAPRGPSFERHKPVELSMRAPNLQNKAVCITSLPHEILIMIFSYSEGSACSRLRQVCRKLHGTFWTFGWEYLQSQMTPISRDWFCSEAIRAEEKVMASCVDSATVVPLVVPKANSIAARLKTRILSWVSGLSPAAAELSDHEVLHHAWLSEIRNFRNVKHNVRQGLFNYTTVEKQSHAAPVILPNGSVLLSRWQCIAIYYKISELRRRDCTGRLLHPSCPESNNRNTWIRAGYFTGHEDTVTSMQFHAPSRCLLSSSFDGTIRRWKVREDDLPEEQMLEESILTLKTTYRPSDMPEFHIFVFDTMELAPPGKEEFADALHPFGMLLCFGTESGAAFLMFADMTSSKQLGVFATHDLPIRSMNFVNKHVFIGNTHQRDATAAEEVESSDDVQRGEVWIVACTVPNIYFFRHTICRRKVVMPDGEKIGYEYFSMQETMTRLVSRVPVVEMVTTFCVPSLYWGESADLNLPAQEASLSSMETQKRPEANGRTLAQYRGNPYVTNPCVLFAFESMNCVLASLNVNNLPGGDAELIEASQGLPFRWDAVDDESTHVTCCAFSPSHPYFVLGSHSGNIRLVAVIPEQMRRSNAVGFDHEQPFSQLLSTVMEETALHSPGGDPPDFTFRPSSACPPTLGPRSGRDPVVAKMISSIAAIRSLTTDFDENSGFVSISLPGHQQSVANVVVDDWKISSIDAHSTVHVYCLPKCELMWTVSQYREPLREAQLPAMNRRNFIQQVIALDGASHRKFPRYVMMQNGTMIITPLAVTNHTLIADFTPLFEEEYFSDPIKALKQSPTIDCDVEEYNNPQHLAKRPKFIVAQRNIFAFHFCYVLFPPFAFGLLDVFIAILLSMLDHYFVHLVYWKVILSAEVLLVLPYFGSSVYGYKPMIAHQNGWTYGSRCIADFLFLVVFPFLFALRHDNLFLTDVSWVLLTIPLQISLLLALGAAVAEIMYERRHFVQISDGSVDSRNARCTMIIRDVLLTAACAFFVAMFSAYFDGPKINGKSCSSFSSDTISIWIVFLPVWFFCAFLASLLPKLLTFNPDPDRTFRSYCSYGCSLMCLFVLYLFLVPAPFAFFCFKFDDYYTYTRHRGVSAILTFNGTGPVSVPKMSTGTIQPLASIPLPVVFSPSMLLIAGVTVLASTNVVMHYRQLVRNRELVAE